MQHGSACFVPAFPSDEKALAASPWPSSSRLSGDDVARLLIALAAIPKDTPNRAERVATQVT